jgi:hypothetical protein
MSGEWRNASARGSDGIDNEMMRGEVVALLPIDYDPDATYSPKGGGRATPWPQLWAEVLICTGDNAGTHEDKVSIRGNLADQIDAQVPEGGYKKTKLLVRVVKGSDVTGDEDVRWWGIEPLTDEEFDEAQAFVREYFGPPKTSAKSSSSNGSRARAGSSSRGKSDAPPF